MAELKTKENEASVDTFLDLIDKPQKRIDCDKIRSMMEQITGEKAKMWGAAIIGFGSYHYVYASGREGDCSITAFSPRTANISLYIMSGFSK